MDIRLLGGIAGNYAHTLFLTIIVSIREVGQAIQTIQI